MSGRKADVKCPLYKEHSAHKSDRVACTDVLDGSVVTVTYFKTTKLKTEWRSARCESFDYRECPLYRAAEKRLEEEK